MAIDKDRYITLLGDPIHSGLLKSFAASADGKATGITAAFLAVAGSVGGIDQQSLLASCLYVSSINIAFCLFKRSWVDKMDVSSFGSEWLLIDRETLQNKAIDKTPSPEQSINSVTKYGMSIYKSLFDFKKTVYVEASLLAFMAYATSPSTSLVAALIFNPAFIVRSVSNIRRFNKLSTGEWAIVDTPPKEPVTDKIVNNNYDYVPT